MRMVIALTVAFALCHAITEADEPEHPALTLVPTATKKGPARLRVQQHGILTCSVVLFWSESKAEPLWGFVISGLGPRDLPALVYGRLPKVPKPYQIHQLRHRFPEKGNPRALAPGETICVGIEILYDWRGNPCGHMEYFRFGVQKDGGLKALPKADEINIPKPVSKVLDAFRGPLS